MWDKRALGRANGNSGETAGLCGLETVALQVAEVQMLNFSLRETEDETREGQPETGRQEAWRRTREEVH